MTAALSLWLILFLGVIAFALYLLVVTVWRFVRAFREGLKGNGQRERPSLRTVLFRTVLVTLLVLFLLFAALVQHNQRGQQWPLSEGKLELRDAQNQGATWLDGEAQRAIEEALSEGAGSGAGGSGGFNLNDPHILNDSPLPVSAIAALKSRGWVVGTGQVAGRTSGKRSHYVAWRATRTAGVFYFWDQNPWYWSLFSYLWALVFGIAVLSPFAAVAAWFLNRRIVKPVQQVAEASVVLADGGEPVPIPTRAPQELSVMAESFNRMAVRLRRAQDTERDFLLSVGHELKTPLTAIDGYAELLADGAVDPKQAAQVLSSESARLRRLIGDLLDLARIDRSEFSVLDEPVDLAAVARQLLERYRATAASLGIDLRVDAEPASACGDAGRLLQVASNLVENALHVTPAGGSIVVTVRPAVLEVSDTGPGLSEHDLEHAFERFYLHRKYAGPEVGTGLGLAIVKELAEAMGGRVQVESQTGRGTTFRVELRRSEAAQPTPA